MTSHDPLRTLKNEHGAIAAVLHGLQHLAHLLRKPGVKPDLKVFHAMLYYIDQFPERQHHPKEDAWLFAKLVERAPQTADAIAQLKREHAECPGRVRELEAALARYEAEGASGAGTFADAVDRYADFHWQHMRREETEIIPLARQHLTAADLADIERAFEGHEDPLAGLREKDFDALFARIVSLAPAPIGLNEPWRRAPR